MSEDVTIDMSKFKAGMAKLQAVGKSDKMLDALEAGAVVIQAHAQNNAREKLNKHPTGNLANSFGIKRKGRQVLVGVWGVVYAAIHEFGGMIEARQGKYLKFQVDGNWVQVTKVHIPARPYLRPAVDENKPAIEKAIGNTLAAIISREIK